MPIISQKNGAFFGPLRPLYPTFQLTDDKYTRTATIWDRGVETTLTVRKIVRIDTGPTAAWGFTPGVSAYDEQIILPAKERVDYYVGELKRYVGAHGKQGIYFGEPAPLRTITIARSGFLDLQQGKAQYQTILPSNDLIELRPETVSQRHPIRKTEAYAGRGSFLYGKFLPASNAWQFYYERWYLFDADRVPDVRRTGIYMNHCRFGIPPYQAEALVKIRVKRKKTIFANCDGWMYGFLAKGNYDPIDKVRRAVIASRAARDTILIDTAVTRLRQAGDIIHPDGTHAVTEYVQN